MTTNTPPTSDLPEAKPSLLSPEDFGLAPQTILVDITFDGATLTCAVPRASTMMSIVDAINVISDVSDRVIDKERPGVEWEAEVVSKARLLADQIAKLTHAGQGMASEDGTPMQIEGRPSGDDIYKAFDVHGVICLATDLAASAQLGMEAKKPSPSRTPALAAADSQQAEQDETHSASSTTETGTPSPSEATRDGSAEPSPNSPSTQPISTSTTG